jgi:hypothetical protein
MPAAKGLLPEAHPQCLGTYWGVCSTPFCGEIVESADAQLFAGAVFNDCATVGYSLNLPPAKLVEAAPYRVAVAGGAGGRVYGCVRMDDFLSALAKRVARNPTSLEIHARMALPAPEPPASEPGAPLQTKVLYKHVQAALTPETIVVAETGDALFNCQKLRLPAGCGYEWSQQFGSIGWSVGAVLGAAAAGAGAGRRVLACIGDGSFQMTAQDVSTMLRYKLNPIIVLANNGGYTIEVEVRWCEAGQTRIKWRAVLLQHTIWPSLLSPPPPLPACRRPRALAADPRRPLQRPAQLGLRGPGARAGQRARGRLHGARHHRGGAGGGAGGGARGGGGQAGVHRGGVAQGRLLAGAAGVGRADGKGQLEAAAGAVSGAAHPRAGAVRVRASTAAAGKSFMFSRLSFSPHPFKP